MHLDYTLDLKGMIKVGSYKCACGKKIKFDGLLLSNEEIAVLCGQKCAKEARKKSNQPMAKFMHRRF